MICRLFFLYFYRHGHHVPLYSHTYIGVVPISTITARLFFFLSTSCDLSSLVFWAIGLPYSRSHCLIHPLPLAISPSP